MKKICTLFALLCLLEFSANAQWQQCKNLNRGSIGSIVANGPTVFAIDGSKLYRSLDNGDSWTAILADSGVRAVVVYKDTIYITTQCVMRSTDNGNTWTALRSGLSGNIMSGLAANGNNIFAIDGAHVYCSTNYGQNWNLLANAPSYSLFSIAIKDSSVFVGTSGAVYRSVDNGNSWSKIGNSYPFSGPGVDNRSIAINGDSIFLGAIYAGTFLSTDNGDTWTDTNGGNSYGFAFSGNNVFAANQQGVLKYNGTGWTSFNHGLIETYMISIASSGNYLFAGATQLGIFRSNDNGNNWTQVGLPVVTVPALAVKNKNILAGTTANGIYLSADNGNSWNDINRDLTITINNNNSIARSIVVKDTDIFAAYSDFNNSPLNIIRSGIHGNSWIEADNGVSSPALSLTTDGTNLYAGTYSSGVYRSTNNGTKWDAVNNGLPTDFPYYPQITAMEASGTTIFALPLNHCPYSSTNSGNSWTQLSNGITDSLSTAMAINGSNIYFGTGFGKVYISNDKGSNWSDISNGLPPNRYVSALAATPSFLFVALGHFYNTLKDKEIYYSRNNGLTWSSTNAGPTILRQVISLCVSDSNILAGTDGASIFKRSLSDFADNGTNIIEAGSVHSDFILYPNPVNNSLHITSTVESYYQIFNTLGALLGESKVKSTFFDIDLRSFSPNLYFIRLQTDKGEVVKKFVKE